MATHRNGSAQYLKLRVTGALGALVAGGWTLAALLTFLFDDPSGTRFLDLPLGAYMAGQGAFVALVLVGVRFASEEGER